MAHLQTGKYRIFYVAFTTPFTSRTLGIENGVLNILPEGVEPTTFFLEELIGSQPPTFKISVNGLNLAPEGERVIANHDTPPHAWFPLHSAPHPPPVGGNAWAFYTRPADPGADAWNAPSQLKQGPTPVGLQPLGYPWWVIRLDD